MRRIILAIVIIVFTATSVPCLEAAQLAPESRFGEVADMSLREHLDKLSELLWMERLEAIGRDNTNIALIEQIERLERLLREQGGTLAHYQLRRQYGNVVVTPRGDGVVILGMSMAGKSLLTAKLLQEGFQFIADDRFLYGAVGNQGIAGPSLQQSDFYYRDYYRLDSRGSYLQPPRLVVAVTQLLRFVPVTTIVFLHCRKSFQEQRIVQMATLPGEKLFPPEVTQPRVIDVQLPLAPKNRDYDAIVREVLKATEPLAAADQVQPYAYLGDAPRHIFDTTDPDNPRLNAEALTYAVKIIAEKRFGDRVQLEPVGSAWFGRDRKGYVRLRNIKDIDFFILIKDLLPGEEGIWWRAEAEKIRGAIIDELWQALQEVRPAHVPQIDKYLLDRLIRFEIVVRDESDLNRAIWIARGKWESKHRHGPRLTRFERTSLCRRSP